MSSSGLAVARVVLPRLLNIGGGSIKTLPEVISSVGSKKPVFLTDPMVKKAGILDKLYKLEKSPANEDNTFLGCISDPTTDSVQKAVDFIKSGGYDSIVAVGGGSPIDTAKAAAVLASFGGKMEDYKVPFELDKKPGLIPIVAIPTTAGTGSEVTKFTVISSSTSGEKMLCRGSAYVPEASIVDYELTFTKPARLTADTAIDSLTHAIESFVSKRRNAFSSIHALAAMGTIPENVITAFEDPSNASAREALMLAATMAGIAFSNASVALVHAMSRPIGAHFHVPHGLSNAMLLPLITQYSIPAAPSLYAECAYAMGAASEDMNSTEACEKLVEALKALNWRLKVPTMQQYGIDQSKYFELVPLMAEQAAASGSHLNNPKVPSVFEMEDLYYKVWEEGSRESAENGNA